MTPEEQIAELTAVNAKLRKENTKRRVGAFTKELEDEVIKLKADMTVLTRERDDALSKAGKPSELQTKIDDLTGQLRGLKHKGAFEKAAADAKVRPKAFSSLWNDLKLKADTDEPDPKAIATAIEELRESHEFYFESTEGQTGEQPISKALGGDRGGTALRGMTITGTQMRDPKFMSENREQIAVHAKAGTLKQDFSK